MKGEEEMLNVWRSLLRSLWLAGSIERMAVDKGEPCVSQFQQTPSKTSFLEIITSVGLMLDLEPNSTPLYHSWRTAVVGHALAERLAPDDVPNVFLACLLADCGGIGFRRHITHELSDHPTIQSQKSEIHLFFHPVTGSESIRRIPGLRRVAHLIRQHHECLNGSGYPEGLKGEKIEVAAQILRLADQFDMTLRTDQPENEKELIQVLHLFSGEDFRPEFLEALESLLEGTLPFGRLMLPEKVEQDIKGIVTSLARNESFFFDEDWTAVLGGIGELIDTRNSFYSRNHASRVAEVADRMAERMGLGLEERKNIHFAACLQNMGEVALRHTLLAKSGRLEEKERQLIRSHPTTGFELISRVSGMEEVARAILHHHENWDGSGYPEGLSMKQIPVVARVIRVADAFDAMTSDRPYHRRKEWKKALSEIRRQAGRQFDPEVVSVAVDVLSA